jgi:aldose 1-epimerase
MGACNADSKTNMEKKESIKNPLEGLSISKAHFGDTPEGPADIYTLKNKSGMEVQISNYGGTVVSIKVPDRNGVFADVALGYDKLSDYFNENNPYFGSIIGRYSNRIDQGKFTLEGQQYVLAQNNNGNHLHGGEKGFDKVLWEAKETKGGDALGLELFYRSKDMEEGYPGNLNVKVFYLLNNQNELLIRYEANTDKTTICNLTNHSYFNLAGEGNGDILDHQLMIKADWITPVNKNLIPTGSMMPVKGTPFDFRVPKAIGKEIDAAHEQIKYGLGYDHNFAFGEKNGKRELIATVYEPKSGRYMEVFSEEPGVQFYTGNFLDGTVIGKKGHKYGYRSALCLETQHYPDSPNQDKFPSSVLKEREVYKTSTAYKFSTRGSVSGD